MQLKKSSLLAPIGLHGYRQARAEAIVIQDPTLNYSNAWLKLGCISHGLKLGLVSQRNYGASFETDHLKHNKLLAQH